MPHAMRIWRSINRFKTPKLIILCFLSFILQYADCDCEGFRSYKVVLGGGNWDQEMSVSVSTWDCSGGTLITTVYGAANPQNEGPTTFSPVIVSLAEG